MPRAGGRSVLETVVWGVIVGVLALSLLSPGGWIAAGVVAVVLAVVYYGGGYLLDIKQQEAIGARARGRDVGDIVSGPGDAPGVERGSRGGDRSE